MAVFALLVVLVLLLLVGGGVTVGILLARRGRTNTQAYPTQGMGHPQQGFQQPYPPQPMPQQYPPSQGFQQPPFPQQ
ncbi:hypothetical protein [Saccharopolyspora taberi]